MRDSYRRKAKQLLVYLMFNSNVPQSTALHAVAQMISSSARLTNIVLDEREDITISYVSVPTRKNDDAVEMRSAIIADIWHYATDRINSTWKGDVEAAFYVAAREYNERTLKEAVGYGTRFDPNAVRVATENSIYKIKTECEGEIELRGVRIPTTQDLIRLYSI